MKLPFVFSGSGGGNGYHNYNESPFDADDVDAEIIDELETSEVDFAEYLWMENEEEFDKNEMQRLEEEELMKQCIENMQEDGYDIDEPVESDGWASERDGYYYETVYGYTIEDHNVANSTLNPLAEEFVPGASSVAH